MKISVVLPVYNGGKYLERMMESLICQTRKADEVIFIDDRSTDDSVEVIRSYINDKCIDGWKVEKNQDNKGAWRNFKEGWRLSEGDLILFCDQDDIWHRDKIRIFEEAFLKNPEMDVMACEKEDFTGREPEQDDKSSEYDPSKAEHVRMYRNSFFTFGCTGCCIGVKRSFMDRISEYWESDELPYDSFIRIMALVNRSYFFYHEVLVFQRLHDNNATKRGVDSGNFDFQKADSESNLKILDSAVNFAHDLREEDMMAVSKRAFRWASLRKDFYNGRFRNGIRLFAYLDCYPRYKAFFEDWKYVLSEVGNR